MQRCLEPELMNDIEQVLAYNSASTRLFARREIIDLYKKYLNFSEGTLIDLGCGTADYLVLLGNEFTGLDITGYDASQTMIDVAQENIKGSNIKVYCSAIKDIDATADCVISTNTLHHIHNTDIFWNSIKRIGKKVFVFDLVRPSNDEIVNNIVEIMTGHEVEIFKTDFRNSLKAAFTKEELLEQIKTLGLSLAVEGKDDFLQVAIIHGEINESI